MKKHVMMLGILALATGLSAQNSIPDHTGTLSYKRTLVPPPDTSRLYHIDGYVCSEGSEHYAPDCVKTDERPTEMESATLKLDDGRQLSIKGTQLAAVAKLEAMGQGDQGTWNVTYRILSTEENPITHDQIQILEVVFPMKIAGKPHPIAKRISVDISSSFLSALDAND